MKIKVNTEARNQNDLSDVDVRGSAAKLKAAMNSLEATFVDRTEEIAIITLAIAAGQHVLLEGLHGVAKSDIARQAFARITNARVYDKMLSKGTVPDDVFGPVLMESYKKGEYEHNTKGRLPTCHFANLEELGRASDLLLPTMMTVLNERQFHNGARVEACPLICAIGTTNFMSTNPELDAYIDRWLARVTVRPLGNNQKCIELLKRCLVERPAITETVSLREVQALNKAVNQMQAADETLPLYVDLVKSYVKEAGQGAYLSDRRMVLGFKLARASAILNDAELVQPEHLDVVKYAIMHTGKDDELKFTTVLQRVVGNSEALKKETQEIKKIEVYVKTIWDKYDSKLDTKVLKELYDNCQKVHQGLQSRSEPPKDSNNQQRFNEAANKIDQLRTELRKVLAARS